jgi:hypothetical protein
VNGSSPQSYSPNLNRFTLRPCEYLQELAWSFSPRR